MLREGVNGEMRLREQAQTRNSSRSRKHMPHRRANHVQREIVDDSVEELGED